MFPRASGETVTVDFTWENPGRKLCTTCFEKATVPAGQAYPQAGHSGGRIFPTGFSTGKFLIEQRKTQLLSEIGAVIINREENLSIGLQEGARSIVQYGNPLLY